MKFKAFFFCAVVLLAGSVISKAETLWESDFQVTGTYSDPQYQTGNFLYYNGVVSGWTSSGFHSAHALLRDGNDWALMVFSGWDAASSNSYTLDVGFAANSVGVTYWVAYDVGATVYANGDQMTTVNDSLRISVIDSTNTEVAFGLVYPGAWNGSQTFHQAYFSYVGTGSGNVRLVIASGNPGSNRFAGAVNNISFQDSQPVPEPSTSLLLLGGVVVLLSSFRSRKRLVA